MGFPTFLEEAQHFEARRVRKGASADPITYPFASWLTVVDWPVRGS